MDLLQDFFARTAGLSQSQIDKLVRLGVPPLALARDADGGGFVLGVAAIEKVGRRFEFVDDGDRAVIVVARDDAGEPADLVAWLPNNGFFGPWFGALPLLGMHDLFAPRLGDPLQVFLDPVGWLRAGRAGVVVLDQGRAWLPLEGITIAAVNVEEGIALRRILDRPKPKIVVPNIVEKIAA